MRDKKAGKEREKKVILYHDELNDEFSDAVITPRVIDESYKYERPWLLRFFWHRIVAVPMAFFYLKIKLGHRIEGREKLKAAKGKPAFIFGNHTQIIGDALIPTFISGCRDPYVIVHPNNVSMPVLGRINPYLGAIPLPDGIRATRNFLSCIEDKVKKNKFIFIYPEAHIWPYYTKIRPFGDGSFAYALKYGTPIFCFVNVYKKRKGKKEKPPRVVTLVEGPFYPKEDLPLRKRRQELRDRVYAAMCALSENSEVEWIEYRYGADAQQEENRTEDRSIKDDE